MLMIPSLDILAITLLNIVISISIIYYFIKKYQVRKLPTTYFWIVGFMFFMCSYVIPVLLYTTDIIHFLTFNDGIPFVILGVSSLLFGIIETMDIDRKNFVRYVSATLTFLAVIAFFIEPVEFISYLILYFLSLLIISGYTYFGILTENYPLIFVSLGLIIQALSGVLRDFNVISIVTSLIMFGIGGFVMLSSFYYGSMKLSSAPSHHVKSNALA